MRYRFVLFAAILAIATAALSVAWAVDQWAAPAEAADLKNPHPATAEAIEKGKALFVQQCTPCHGTSGKGDGPAGKFLGKPLPNFATLKFQEQSDGALFWKISTGNAPMPTFKDILGDEQRWLVVDYVRTFTPAEEKGGNK